MDQQRYRSFLADLTRWARDDERVIGLVALGSAANRSHTPDEWSDHDLWVVTVEGGAAGLRTDPVWLPDADRIAGWFVETEHGRSAVYDDGHLVEVAIFNDSELEIARANDFRVLFGDVEGRLARIAARTEEEGGGSATHAAGRFIVEMMIGMGRLGRGELVSANELIRGRAVASLVRAISSPVHDLLDNLDPHRRFEVVYPDTAERINRSLDQPLVDVAASLIEIAAGELPGEVLSRRIVEVLEERVAAVRATRRSDS